MAPEQICQNKPLSLKNCPKNKYALNIKVITSDLRVIFRLSNTLKLILKYHPLTLKSYPETKIAT